LNKGSRSTTDFSNLAWVHFVHQLEQAQHNHNQQMANHGPVYGMDAELKAKRDASYDPKLENDAKNFIESTTGTSISDLQEDLKSGVVLCKLMNKVYPGKVGKISSGSAPFVQMENIAAYLKACASLGLATHDLFQTVDLYEAKNMNQVVTNILALKRISSGGSSSSKSSGGGGGGGGGGKFCSSCGAKGSGKFCPSCGNAM